MSDSNRRGFLIAGAATVAGAAAVAATRSDRATTDLPPAVETADAADAGSAQEIVAHVHDVRAGTISLMVEGHQVSVTDPTLAARIAKAMRTTTV